MGSTGGRSDAGVNRTVAMNINTGKYINQKGKKPTRKDLNKSSPILDFIAGGGITGAIIKGVTGAIKTANIKSKQNLMDYEGQAAGVTSVRGPNNFTPGRGGNNNSNIVVPLTTVAPTSPTVPTSPTTAEVSQSAATDVASTEPIDNILSKKKKTKATGRSMTILTSSTGVKSDDKLTLGKKSLLGQ